MDLALWGLVAVSVVVLVTTSALMALAFSIEVQIY
jgi:hypothetical protein